MSHLRASRTWITCILAQAKSITSKQVTKIGFYYWLDADEIPPIDFWKELDATLSRDIFSSLIWVDVGCVYKDSDLQWHYSGHFVRSNFCNLLPNVYKKGVLTW